MFRVLFLAVAIAPAAGFAPALPSRWAQAQRANGGAGPLMSSPPARTGGGSGGDDGEEYRKQIENTPKPVDRTGIQRLFGDEPLDMSEEARAKRMADRRDPNSQFNKARRARKNARLQAEAEAAALGMTYQELIVSRAQEELGENFERWGMMPTPTADGADPFEEELGDDEDIFIREEDIPAGMSEEDESLQGKVIIRRLMEDKALDSDEMRPGDQFGHTFEPSVSELRAAYQSTDLDTFPSWLKYTDENGVERDIRPAATKEDLPMVFKHLYHEWREAAERNPGAFRAIPSKEEIKTAWEQFKFDNRHLADSPEDLPPSERGMPKLCEERMKMMEEWLEGQLEDMGKVAEQAVEYDATIQAYIDERLAEQATEGSSQ